MRAFLLLALVSCAQSKAPEPVVVQVEAGAAPVVSAEASREMDAAVASAEEPDASIVCGPDESQLACQLRKAARNAPDGSAPFDRSQTSDALRVDVKMCARANGLRGAGHVKMKFEPTGIPSTVTVDPPYAGTPEGTCIIDRFKTVRVPPFSGAPVSIGKSFVLN